MNACDGTFATAPGADQLLPPSIDFENRICEESIEGITFHATYAVPSGAMSSDAMLYARTTAPESGSCGADGRSMLATFTALDHVFPPSVERLAMMSHGLRGSPVGRNGVRLASTYRFRSVPSGKTLISAGSGSVPVVSVVIAVGLDHVLPPSLVLLKYSTPCSPSAPSRRTQTMYAVPGRVGSAVTASRSS